MFAKDYWKSKELYKEISIAIPDFGKLIPGQKISIKDEAGNLSYRVSTTPIKSINERIEDTANSIVVNGKPNSRMTMFTRTVVHEGLGFLANMMMGALKSVDIDLEAYTRNDFDVFLEDIRSKAVHWVKVNHSEGKAEHLISYGVEFNKEGQVIKENGILEKDSKDIHQMVKSEEFKTKFDTLRQNRIE